MFHETRQILSIHLKAKCSTVMDDHGHQTEVPITRAEHEAIVKRFKRYHANHLPDAGYQLVADFTNASGKLHWHGFAVGSSVDEVKAAWSKACGDNAVETDIRPIETTVERACGYAFKVRGHNRGKRVRLPAIGLHATPTHNFFRGVSKATLFKDFKARYFGEAKKL